MVNRPKSTGYLAVLAAVSVFGLIAGSLYARETAFEALIENKGEPAAELFDDPTLYRETKLTGLPGTVDDFDFLLDRPRTSMALAGKLHKSLDRYRVEPLGDGGLHIDDSKSLVGDLELFSHTPGERLYYVTGHWRLMPGITLKGRMALLVDYTQKMADDGPAFDARARGYMMVDNTVAGVAFKVFVGLFPRKVDARIERFATAVRKVVVAVHDEPGPALERLKGSPLVPEDEVSQFRERFVAGGLESMNVRYKGI
jgi:hypothetical protein